MQSIQQHVWRRQHHLLQQESSASSLSIQDTLNFTTLFRLQYGIERKGREGEGGERKGKVVRKAFFFFCFGGKGSERKRPFPVFKEIWLLTKLWNSIPPKSVVKGASNLLDYNRKGKC